MRNQLLNYMKGHVCALLVQHEKYHHKGNLKRIKKHLPYYYIKRVNGHAKKLLKGEFSSLFTEIKGSIAGWKYYQRT